MCKLPTSTKKKTAAKPAKSKKTTPNIGEEKYKCLTCGHLYSTQTRNFRPTKSPLYAANNGFLPFCVTCMNADLKRWADEFGDEEKAMRRVCMHYNIYFHPELYKIARIGNGIDRLIGTYYRNLNFPAWGMNEKTYDDTILEESASGIVSIDDVQKAKENGDISISDSTLKRWDVGFDNEEDYKSLDNHYKILKKQNPNCDNNQEIFIKDLCYIKLKQIKSLKDNKIDDFKKLTELYRDTFKQAGLKTVQETDSSNEETMGVTLAVISQYTPEEYYKDKKLYKDFDWFGDYITRFITRPLKNLQFGSKDRDKEYCVKDSDDEYDE